MRLFKLVLVLAVFGSLYWYGAAFVLRLGITTWFETRAAQGWQADFSDIQNTGYPLRHVTTLTNPALADPKTGAAWHGDWISFDSPAIWPGEQTLRFAATPQYLSYFDHSITLIADNLTAELHLQAGLALELGRMTLTAGPWAIQGDDAQIMSAQSLTVAMVQTEPAETYRFDISAARFTPGPAVRRLIRSSASLPADFQTLQMDMTVRFDHAWDRTSLEQKRPQPRQIDLRLAELHWGELRLFATGALSIDTAGQPTGTIAIKAENWREMLTMVHSAGVIPTQLTGPAESVLGLLAGLGGNPNSLDIKLNFKDGMVRIGPLPIGPAPKFILR